MIYLFLIFLISCTHLPEHIVEANKIQKSYNRYLKSQDIAICGSGGAFCNDIKEFIYDLTIYDSPDISKAREYLIKNFEILLQLVNNTESVKPFLHEFPHTSKSGHFAISFHVKPYEYPLPPLISRVSLYHGKVYYSIFDREEYKDVFSETYEEALQKAKMPSVTDHEKSRLSSECG